MKNIFILLLLLSSVYTYSQIVESFDDGDFTNNPVWSGDTSKYEVITPSTSGDGSLNASAGADSKVLRSKQNFGDAVLTTPNTTAYGEWRFSIADGYNWSVSSTNDYFIVLMSNDSTVSKLKDGTKNFNGYFLRFKGGSGNDDFGLFKQVGTTETEILNTSYPGTADGTTAIGRSIKITRSDLGEWKIFIDDGFGISASTQRGVSVVDNIITTSSWFGIVTNIANPGLTRVVYFDNLYIGSIVGDTIKPLLNSVEALSPNTLVLNFSEELDSTSASDILNYSVNNLLGNPTTAILNSTDKKTVTLSFASNFTDGFLNNISVAGVTDLSGNIIDSTTADFTYYLIKAEFVSIISATEINLTFSQIFDSTTANILSNYTLDNSFGNPVSYIIDPSFKSIKLTFAQSFISGTTYTLNIQNVTDINANPIVSTNLNFLYFVPQAYDIVINEIMADPSPVVLMPDAEYMELKNNTSFDIDIKNWTITIGSTVKTISDYILPSNSYLIVCHSSMTGIFQTYGNTIGLFTSSSTLTNSGTTIILKNELGLVIDSVQYSDTWYQDGVKKGGGWSLEKIDPLNNCSGSNNWIASTSNNGGTPGIINSVNASNLDTIAPTIIAVEVFSNHINITFSENINTVYENLLNNFSVNNGIGNPNYISISENLMSLYFSVFFTNELSNTLIINNISDFCNNIDTNITYNFSYIIINTYDVVINELMPDPTPLVQLPNGEYLELYNTTSNDLNLKNWSLTIGSSVTIFPDITISANNYLIVCHTSMSSVFQIFGNTAGLFTSTSALTNSGTTITLKSNQGQFVDSVQYSDTWYKSTSKDEGGWSLEKIDPLNNCSGSLNWIASIDTLGGSPARINSVNASFIDSIAPKLTSIYVIDSNTVSLTFSEIINFDSANLATNYFVNNGIGNPESVIISDSTVNLNFAVAFTNELSNTLTINSVSDNCNNDTTNLSGNFSYLIIFPYDVVINELMPDPNPIVLLPDAEYLELYNTTDNDINLKNWAITIGTSSKIIPEITIAANNYLILCHTSMVSIFQNYGNAVGISGFSLSNDGTTIKLNNNVGLLIDTVQYSILWYQDAAKKSGGWSLEKIDPSNNCSGKANWIESVDFGGGTPGFENSVKATNIDSVAPTLTSVFVLDSNSISLNFSEIINSEFANLYSNYLVNNGIGNPDSISVYDNIITLSFSTAFTEGIENLLSVSNMSDFCDNIVSNISGNFTYFVLHPNDVVINEIMADPNPVVALSTWEYLELYNRTNHSIDITGWNLTIGITTVNIPNLQIEANGYLLICSNYAYEDVSIYGNTVAIFNLPALIDDGKNISITDNNNTLIATVTYSKKWYGESSKSSGGWSLEAIDPFNTCGGIYNWKASVDERGGTPGSINSIFASNIDSVKPDLEYVMVYNDMTLLAHFSEVIKPESALTISNYVVLGYYIDSAKVDINDGRNIFLYFNQSFAIGVENQLDIQNIYDQCDNLLLSDSAKFTYNKVYPYDLIINELMIDEDPVVGLPKFEYLELYNRTTHDIDLIGWTYIGGTTIKEIPFAKIQAGSYLLLCNANNVSAFQTFGNVVGITSFSLANTGQSVTIKDYYGEIIHSVSYSDKWYNNSYKADGGWSLELIDQNNPCGEMSNWTASINPKGGTPCAKNSVFASNSDLVAPILSRAFVYNLSSNDTLKVWFNEPLKKSTLTNKTYYSVDNDFGNPISVIPIENQFYSVLLVFDTAFSKGKIYKLTVKDSITDCVGNKVSVDNSCRFAIPDTAIPNDIIINEVLFDPLGDGVDFVELYNNSDKIVSLRDLKLTNRSGNTLEDNVKIISSEDFLFFPHEFKVITTSPEMVQSQYTCPDKKAFVKAVGMPTYSNTDGAVVLVDTWMNIIDEMTYTDKMHYALLVSVDGVSLERINYNRPSDDETNWHSAAENIGFATPGYKNSQYSENIENTSELLITPEIFSPDNDGYNDVLNISYKMDNSGYDASISIYDSRGRLVRKLVQNELLSLEGIFSWDGLTDARTKAGIGIYIIYFEAFDLTGNVIKRKEHCVLATKF